MERALPAPDPLGFAIHSFTVVVAPTGKGTLVPNSPHLFWNNLEFTGRLYYWYRG